METIAKLLREAETTGELTVCSLFWCPPKMTMTFFLHGNSMDTAIIYGTRTLQDNVEFLDVDDLVDELWCTPNLVFPK